MQVELKEKIKSLLEENKIEKVLAWEKGENSYERTPALFSKENLENMQYDDFCGPNLSKYLINEAKGEGKILMLVKPCDSYSLNQLCTENRVKREKVFALGVGCRGKIDVEKIKALGIKAITDIEEQGEELLITTLYGDAKVNRKAVLLNKCQCCKGKEHKNVDEVFGTSEETTTKERMEEVEKIEKMNPEERFLFWRSQLSKCIRCNACRNVCPACSCIKCVFDNPNSGVQNKAAADDFEENMFHIIRAFHVAGRCTDCGECSRVCPEGIPLHLLNRKFIKDMGNIYGEYQAGEEIGQIHPLISFDRNDPNPGEV